MPQTRLKEGLAAKARIFWPISALAMIVLLVLIWVGLALINQFDRAAIEREQNIVTSGIAQRVEEISELPRPQVIWDDAVRNLDNRYDSGWAQQNIGTYLDKTDHFDSSYVLNAHDQPIFAYDDGKTAELGSYTRLAKSAAPLVAQVRSQEAARLLLAHANQAKLGEPVQSSGIVGDADDVHILTATLVEPDFGTARIEGRRAPVVVTDMTIDGDFLLQFGNRFLLSNIHMHPGDSRSEPEEAHVALRDHDGVYVATIDWIPQRPGTALLKSVGVPAVSLICFLVLMLLYFFHRGMRTNAGLILSEARADHLAHHDDLTGLPNRLNFISALGRTIEQLRDQDLPIAILSIDLDRFEEISEVYGHRAADEYVEEASRRMSKHCRPADLLARFSADEFGMIVSKASPKAIAELAERLCKAIADPMELSSGQIFAGCTVGIALVDPSDRVTATEALRHADIALHRAKEHARGHFCLFESEMDAVVKSRRSLEIDLRQALKDETLQLHYQPQVDRHSYVTGVEALVRWNHHLRGQVSPALFIPIAEQCGLIMDLGIFTLRRAFEDSRRWVGLKIAINVSAIQIANEEFVSKLAALTSEMGVNPDQFELEITEGILINDDPRTQAQLRTLREMGFALALDDFGTGYSSLSYLSRYPIDKIKIDRSFISNLGRDAGADAVVSAIIKLARALKLAVIAEGVETYRQKGQLAQAGCFNIQGYLYSRALPAEDVDLIYSDRARLIEATEALAA